MRKVTLILALILFAQIGLGQHKAIFSDSILIPAINGFVANSQSVNEIAYFDINFGTARYNWLTGKIDTLRPKLRNLVLHCQGPVCYVNLRANTPQYKQRYFTHFDLGSKGGIGLCTQLTDLNFLDGEGNLTAAYPLGFPIASGDFWAFHRYLSRSPIFARLDDTLAFILSPTQIRDTVRGEESGKFSMLAFFSLADKATVLPDTLSDDTLKPFFVGEELALPSQEAFWASPSVIYGGIRVHPTTELFYAWNPLSPTVSFYNSKGEKMKELGQEGAYTGRLMRRHPIWKGWRKRDPAIVPYWQQPIFSDVWMNESASVAYRLVFARLDPKIIEGKKIRRMCLSNERYRFDGFRAAYLQVYDYASGKLQEEWALPTGEWILKGEDEKGRLVLWNKVGWEEKIYFMQVEKAALGSR